MAMRVLATKYVGTLASGTRGMSALAVKLPDLPYDFSALEPAISGAIMQVGLPERSKLSVYHQACPATQILPHPLADC